MPTGRQADSVSLVSITIQGVLIAAPLTYPRFKNQGLVTCRVFGLCDILSFVMGIAWCGPGFVSQRSPGSIPGISTTLDKKSHPHYSIFN